MHEKYLSSATPITKRRVLIVEGEDERRFFSELIKYLSLDDIQIVPLGGIQKFHIRLPILKKTPGFKNIFSLGIVRDADESFEGAFSSICSILQNNGIRPPQGPLQQSGTNPIVTVFIMPNNKLPGMIEDLCLDSVADDPVMECVDSFIDCIRSKINDLPDNSSKAKIRSFLISREFLEEIHFKMIAKCLENFTSQKDTLAKLNGSSLIKLHAFLTTRYRPGLRLGEAAEAGYWPFNNSAFATLRDFLQNF